MRRVGFTPNASSTSSSRQRHPAQRRRDRAPHDRWFYRALKDYRLAPTPEKAERLRAQFDRIFNRMRTSYATLDKLLRRLFRLKDDLLRVLDRPEIPLHTNASESDIRVFVTKRKVSGGTVSDRGRDARDIMTGLAKTCTSSKSPSSTISAPASASQAP